MKMTVNTFLRTLLGKRYQLVDWGILQVKPTRRYLKILVHFQLNFKKTVVYRKEQETNQQLTIGKRHDAEPYGSLLENTTKT
jgi:hypothetical protein